MKPVYQLEEDRVTGDDPTARVCRAGRGTRVVGERSGLGERRRGMGDCEGANDEGQGRARRPPAPLGRRGYCHGAGARRWPDGAMPLTERRGRDPGAQAQARQPDGQAPGSQTTARVG